MDAPEGLRITEAEVRRRKAYLQIEREDEDRLRRVHHVLQRHAERIIDAFYDFLLSDPYTRSVLEQPGLLERLKAIQLRYLERLTQGTYDADYFQDRLKAGLAHERFGLRPEWYLGAYWKYLTIIADILRHEMDPESFHRTMVSLTKVMYLDMGLAMDAYIQAGQERLLARTRELQELDAKKKLLTETIVHDLRNPLAGLQGFLSILRSRAERLADSERRALREAERAVVSLNEMVDNVLDISRMEESKLAIARERLDLEALVRETLQVLRPFAELQRREVRTSFPGGPVEVRTDGRLLRRILMNLVMNSLRHATGASYVGVSAGRLAGGAPYLMVQDDGAGVDPRLHAQLFEKFGAPGLRGLGVKAETGLGLVFCRMAARELGLELEFDSDVGRGTRVRLLFPRDGAEPA